MSYFTTLIYGFSGTLDWRRRMFSFAIDNTELLDAAFGLYGSDQTSSSSASNGAFSYSGSNSGSNQKKSKTDFVEEYEEIPYGEMIGGKFQVTEEEESDSTNRLQNSQIIGAHFNG